MVAHLWPSSVLVSEIREQHQGVSHKDPAIRK